MMPVRAARYDYVHKKACQFIIEQKLRVLPADPFKLVESNKWGLVTYRELAAAAGGMNVDDVILTSCSMDGFSIYNGKNYCIAYNSDIKVFAKIVFTLFREIGHIFLCHLSENHGHELTEREYAVLEEEAEDFACEVLAPSFVIEKCNLKTARKLSYACGITIEAAEKRLELFKRWSPCKLDYKVLELMKEYISYGNQPEPDFSAVEMWYGNLGISLNR